MFEVGLPALRTEVPSIKDVYPAGIYKVPDTDQTVFDRNVLVLFPEAIKLDPNTRWSVVE